MKVVVHIRTHLCDTQQLTHLHSILQVMSVFLTWVWLLSWLTIRIKSRVMLEHRVQRRTTLLPPTSSSLLPFSCSWLSDLMASFNVGQNVC